jgi:hypothetical protein
VNINNDRPIFGPILNPEAVDAVMADDWRDAMDAATMAADWIETDAPRDLDFDWTEEGF